jgi:hypothetical protein
LGGADQLVGVLGALRRGAHRRGDFVDRGEQRRGNLSGGELCRR